MRKVKALEILAAAIAVVPCTVFAVDDEIVPSRPAAMDRPASESTAPCACCPALRPLRAPPRADLTPAARTTTATSRGSARTTAPGSRRPTGTRPACPTACRPTRSSTEQRAAAIVTMQLRYHAQHAELQRPPDRPAMPGPSSGTRSRSTMAGGVDQRHATSPPSDFPSTGKFFGNAIGLPAAAPDPRGPSSLAARAG